MGFDYLTRDRSRRAARHQGAGLSLLRETARSTRTRRLERHEQLVGMAYIAAKTSRIRLVAAVLVVPHRPAVLAAKMLATLDVLSGGRLVVGIGAGWLKTEFDAVVTTPFAERGAVTDEYIDAFRVLWTEASPRFAGKYVKFDGIVLEPKPMQRPHPPIWVGGEGRPSRCAAPRASAMPGIRSAATTSICSTRCRGSRPASPACARRRAEAGRDPASMGVSYQGEALRRRRAAQGLRRRTPPVLRQRGRPDRGLPRVAEARRRARSTSISGDRRSTPCWPR